MYRETPTFTAREINQIESMAGLGMNVEQMAHVIGVSKATFDRRQAAQPAVHDAISKGRALASMCVRKTAYQMATSGKCPAMTIFWLKTREGWKEPRDEDDHAPIKVIAGLSTEELLRLVQAKVSA